MLDVVFGQASHRGDREHNEDALSAFIPESARAVTTHGWMFAVADGVGGLDFGDVASSMTVAALRNGYAMRATESSLITLLPELIQNANATVHDELLMPMRRGKRMASTVVACALRQDRVVVAHVGDSRCYHLRNGNMQLLTSDHTVAREQLQMGLITQDEEADSSLGHLLTRAVGSERYVQADACQVMLQPGDRLLLCTDGLYKALTEEEIAAMAGAEQDPQTIANRMVTRAIAADESDNVTACLIQVRSVDTLGMYRGRPYRIQAG